jgi:hypothetical protein
MKEFDHLKSRLCSTGIAAARRVLVCSALFLAFAANPKGSWAQTAAISGTLSAFDVLNDTGQPAHGFEIQIEGATAGDLYYTVPAGRYGNPSVVPYATGVYVRYQSAYSATSGQYTATTPPAATTAFSWQDCYLGGAGYSTSGCEHLGQSMRALPPGTTITVTGRWLVDDPNNPGQLIAMNPPAAVPFVGWFVASSTAAPIVVAKVVAPLPPPPAQFSDAQWVKIFKTELPRSVSGDELTSSNTAVVPEDPTQIETAWDILQTAPPNANTRKNRSTRNNQAALSLTAGSVVRRYELYKYTGAYDPITHEVACADGTCTAPSAGELGGPLSAHNTASNVTPDTLTVTKSGSGASASITGTGINCGGTCAAFAANGAVVSLTASPGSTIFTGWTGACTGTQLTCSATVNGKTVVGASFMLQFTLSVGRSNSGTVIASPNGNDRALNCGGNCSAKFTDGALVTLTATPPDGKQFVNWSGGCSGTSPVCTITISKDTSVQAVFSK